MNEIPRHMCGVSRQGGLLRAATRALGAALVMCALTPIPSNAQADIRETCVNGTARAAVAACTAMLESRGLNDSDKASAYLNRGNAFDNLGDLEGALKDYDRALAVNPRSAQVHRNRGAALNRRGRFEEAFKDFDAAVLLQPDYALAYASRAENLEERAKSARTSQDRASFLERGVADWDRSIALGIEPVESAYFGRGKLNYYLGRVDAAIDDLSRALTRLTNEAEAYVVRALALADRGRCDQANADLEQLSRLAGNGPEAVNAIRPVRDYVTQRCR